MYVIWWLGGPFLGKTVPEVLSMRPRAILETKGTVFPTTDLPGVANNILIFFYGIAVKGRKMSFTWQKFMLKKKGAHGVK